MDEQGKGVHIVLGPRKGGSPPFTLEPEGTVFMAMGAGDNDFSLLSLPGQPMTFPPEALWVTVGLSVCLVALLVALAFVCWRKIKQSCEEENAGERGVWICVHMSLGMLVCL